MTHLRIEQNNGVIEEVSTYVISKLYDLAVGGEFDSSSNLKGRLHSQASYKTFVQYLTQEYPELHISVDQYYVEFTDPEVSRVLGSMYGDGIGITEQAAASITSLNGLFKGNTTVQTFDELSQLGVKTLTLDEFKGCTNLVSVDTSKITNIDRGWTFLNCSNLQIIDLSGLDGTSPFFAAPSSSSANIFANCTSLKKVILGNVQGLGNQWASFNKADRLHFYNCPALTTVDVKSLFAPIACNGAVFENCPNMRNFILRDPTPQSSTDTSKNISINYFGGSNVKIYVPDDSVSDYKSATGWTDIASYIYPLSEYVESEL